MSESDGSNLSDLDLRVHIWNTANNHGCIMSIAIDVEAAREAVIKRCGRDIEPIVAKEPDHIEEFFEPYVYVPKDVK